MSGDKYKDLSARFPDRVKFMEDSGYVRDDPRGAFSRTLPGGHLLEMPYYTVAESELEDLETMLSPLPAHSKQDFKE